MAELENDKNINLPEGSDTKTRKTVRLKPSGLTPAAIKLPQAGSMPIADPLTGRDTDTGNLEVLEDTQTRRTVKLKPIAPQQPRPAVQPIAIEPGTAAPVADGADTQTRRTVVLRPSATPATSLKVNVGGIQPLKPATPAAVPAAPTEEGASSKQTVVLSPDALQEVPQSDVMENTDTVKVAALPKTAPGPAVKLNADKKTVTLDAAALSDAPPAAPTSIDEGDATIRIQRPVRKPMVPPRPAAAPAVPPKVEAPKVETPKAEAAEVKAEAPKAEEVKPAIEEVKPEIPAQTAAVAPLSGPALEFDDADMLDIDSVSQPSPVYTILAALTLLLVAATAVISTVQYLNLCKGQNIELPGLPTYK